MEGASTCRPYTLEHMAKFGEHFPETTGFVVGNQDQVIIRNNYKKIRFGGPQYF
jgi:hypothetical protein